MFYIGLDHAHHSAHFERAFISVNTVRGRKKPVPGKHWILDSGAFRELEQYGAYRHDPADYAGEVNRLARINPGLSIAVTQDWMCEPFILEKTGLDIAEHQRRTIERYDALLLLIDIYLMPVLQGYTLQDYLSHIEQYGERLRGGMHVGVGSICKRNTNMWGIEAILAGIKTRRPDLKLHGFGIKTSALFSGVVRDCLHSADSMAWSFAARKDGRDQHDWREARDFVNRIETMHYQHGWMF